MAVMDIGMKLRLNLNRRSTQLALAAIVTLVVVVLNARAHDPGINSVSVEIGERQISIYSSFAAVDLPAVGKTDPKTFTTRIASVTISGVRTKPESSEIYSDQLDGVIVKRVFAYKGEHLVTISGALPEHLRAGQTQVLTIAREGAPKEFYREVFKGEFEKEFDISRLEMTGSSGAFISLGIKHIVFGFDHLLFLFALLITAGGFPQIVGIVSLFTLAHSITLSLSVLGYIAIPAAVVEPIIALSIVYAAISNFVFEGTRPRFGITYVFGLIHGLGFAAILKDIGIGSGADLVWPLLSFNLGVEIGQLTIILFVLPILWWLNQAGYFGLREQRLVSCGIAAAGLYWFVERVFI